MEAPRRIPKLLRKSSKSVKAFRGFGENFLFGLVRKVFAFDYLVDAIGPFRVPVPVSGGHQRR